MGAKLLTFTVKDPDTIRDDGLRTLRAGLIARGIPSPNVGPDSDFYAEFTAFANELAVVEANAVIKSDATMPDTATGEDLINWLASRGLAPRPAGGSTGPITFSASAASLVATGAALVDGAGLRYEVTVGGTYSDGDTIPIKSISLGEATNLEEGSALRWQVAPPFSAPTCVVGVGGLINGVDAEDEEAARARLMARLQNSPGGGNWQQVAEIAEAASPVVEKAFVYPAVQGPSTVHIAVTAAPTATNKSRVVATPTMTGTIVPYIAGQLAEHAYVRTTTVQDNEADVAIAVTLPEASSASPPGPGGGWLDGTPWPSVDGTSYFKVAVTSVTSTTEFTVDARTAPVANVARIAWFSPDEWKLYTATVTAFSGTAGAYVITIDTPFVGIDTGDLIFPQSVNQATYMAALLAAFRLMGPGEKTGSGSALVRGFRHPAPVTAWPSSLGPHILRALTDAGEEVESTQFLWRYSVAAAASISGASGVLYPKIPSSIDDGPWQFVPRNLAIYRLA